MLIEDVKTGFKVGVTKSNRLLTSGVNVTVEHATNQDDGEAYNAGFSQSPTANDDCIFYMQNSSETDIVCEGVVLSTDVACEVYIKLEDSGTRNAATTVTAGNLNAGSGKTADATIEQGVDLGGGTATLGGGYETHRYIYAAASDSKYMNFNQDVILPKNRTLTIYCSSLSATITGFMVFNFHNSALV